MNTRTRRSGLIYADQDKAYQSLISFSALDGKTHLINMEGQQVHQWDYQGLPGDVIDPNLIGGKRGHVLVQYEMIEELVFGIYGNRIVAEVDWNGDPVWKWGEQAPSGAARQNHDWQRLANGNTLLLITKPRVVPLLGDVEVGDQGIYEVNPAGEIVWSWLAGDHIEEFGFSEEGLNDLRQSLKRKDQDPWGYLELNTSQILGPNKWYDGRNEVFHPDNIIISSRKGNFVAIIEKKSGNIVWRIGPYSSVDSNPYYRLLNREVPRPLDQTSGQHKPHLIPEGLPGAGNLILLDNQGGAGYPPVSLATYAGSRVLEINPVTKEIVWQYTAEDSGDPVWSFHTSFVGNVQRLPNGNTLINEGMNGRIFQITASGEIVWEYINPYPGFTSAGTNTIENPMVYRAQAVPFDWVPEI
ncbi:arylsulfotransferase family protein [Aciduricibacillus chroicocephali]|uniref:Arylsulfotransferase family protein n=1 Tax=Aciduricibacillus chroicocephali TaxID=3054939 RepID=A0ABY9KUT0_9BACI|nr:arylsulfotransferase family protein [Bacillaceae bacterium 44XB]